MTMVSACPACDAVPAAEAAAQAEIVQDAQLALSVPGVHCGACIATVERALQAEEGVHSARVNLTLKRASVEADADIDVNRLVAALVAAGYEAHELDAGTLSATASDKAGRDLLMRVGIAGFAAMNVMLLSVSVWSGADSATRDLFHWISAAIALPAIAFTGKPFFVSAWSALKARRLNMDVPIVLAIALALVTSLWETMLSARSDDSDVRRASTRHRFQRNRGHGRLRRVPGRATRGDHAGPARPGYPGDGGELDEGLFRCTWPVQT